MLSKYDYEKLAEQVSDNMIEKDIPMNKSISLLSIEFKLNPEQIKRLSELSNIKAYNKTYDTKEDKTFTFDLADSKEIIDDVYDNKGEGTKIVGMPPVEYKAEVNPKKPEITSERLGDDNEIVISKNTQNSEDAASDNYLDALKIPKKDYSYSENEIEEDEEQTELKDEESDSDSSEVETTDMEDEEEKDELNKEAFLQNKLDIAKELDNRIMLISDKIVDETRKVASHFRGVEREQKFANFVKNAQCLYSNNSHLNTAINLVKDNLHLNDSKQVVVSTTKIASKDFVGHSSFNSLLDLVTEYKKLSDAKQFLG